MIQGPTVLKHVIEQHADEAAFLSARRVQILDQPNIRFKDLIRFDWRLDAHLDGLRNAGVAGWNACEVRSDTGQPGQVFAAAVLALENRQTEWIEGLLDLAASTPYAQQEVIEAIGWTSPPLLQGLVKSLLTSESSFRRRMGITACMQHRVNPGGGHCKSAGSRRTPN